MPQAVDEELVSEEPLRQRVTIPTEAEELTLDDRLNVIGVAP